MICIPAAQALIPPLLVFWEFLERSDQIDKILSLATLLPVLACCANQHQL